MDPDDDQLSRTYYQKSLIFVADEHSCWDPEGKRPKRRHGRLQRSGKSRLQEMLHAHQEDIWEHLESKTEDWREEQRVKKVAVRDTNITSRESGLQTQREAGAVMTADVTMSGGFEYA